MHHNPKWHEEPHFVHPLYRIVTPLNILSGPSTTKKWSAGTSRAEAILKLYRVVVSETGPLPDEWELVLSPKVDAGDQSAQLKGDIHDRAISAHHPSRTRIDFSVLFVDHCHRLVSRSRLELEECVHHKIESARLREEHSGPSSRSTRTGESAFMTVLLDA